MSRKNFTLDDWNGDEAKALTAALVHAIDEFGTLVAGILNATANADGTIGLQIELDSGHELLIDLKPNGEAEWTLFTQNLEVDD